jgi:hypothetical protein
MKNASFIAFCNILRENVNVVSSNFSRKHHLLNLTLDEHVSKRIVGDIYKIYTAWVMYVNV